MTLYQITIPKSHPLGAWSNIYYADVANVTQALGVGNDVGALEASISYSPTVVGPATVRIPGVPNSGARSDLSFTGALDPSTLGGTLPLFCTVRVDFAPTSGSRGERKFLRLPGNQENTQNGGLWSGELVDFVQDNYCAGLSLFVSLRGPNGEDLGAGTVSNKIQMRQSDWHRRTRPGFHRGWVPNV